MAQGMAVVNPGVASDAQIWNWFASRCTEDPFAATPTSDLVGDLRDWLGDHGATAPTANRLTRWLRERRNIPVATKRVDGRVVRCYLGLRLAR